MSDIRQDLDKIGAETATAIKRFMGDEETYLNYVRAFPDEPTMDALVQAMDRKDYAAAEKSVHALKGIVAGLDFLPLADAAVDMLEEFRDGNVEAALDAYEDVKKEYNLFCNVIHAWKSN